MTSIRTNKTTALLLMAKKEVTGQSMTKLVEFAVMNMPYIPPKRVKK